MHILGFNLYLSQSMIKRLMRPFSAHKCSAVYPFYVPELKLDDFNDLLASQYNIPIETGNQLEHCIFRSTFQQLHVCLPLQHSGLGRILPTVVSSI